MNRLLALFYKLKVRLVQAEASIADLEEGVDSIVEPIPLDYLDTDEALTADSDEKVPTQAAVKAFVEAAVAALVDSSPAALDTLNELAAALGDDENYATTINNALAEKLPSNKLLRSYLAATVTYNDVDVLADTLLSVAVEASGIYDIELTVHATATTNSINMDFGGSATITNFLGQWRRAPVGAPAATDDLVGARVTAADTDFSTAEADGEDSIYTFKGSIEVNGAGTFLLRAAQRAASADNATILRGSTLILTKTN